ncbi:hypothetical protein [uncultured Agrobacterium sp.]|uniref:COG3904 family protein n=1 Tax=uncultured Agrobacterium sp. TaxID=157277 RepID=UPI0025E728BB|nr:hypothetical protein [uncultured Agrobacterium sp.]
MNFILVSDGDCSDTCVQWVSAEGAITHATPTRFAAFLATLKNRKLPIVIQSVGGDVDAALAIGQMIRNRKLDTAIGRTQLNDCPMLDPRCKEKMVKGGWSSGTVRSGGAYCFSACPFVVAGGVNRAASPNTSIGLHQITNGTKDQNYGRVSRRNLDAISTRKDDRIEEKLGTYLDAMGVRSKDVFAMMGLATPDGLYSVLDEEALKTGLITKVYSLEEEPGFAFTPEVSKTPVLKSKPKG